MARVLAIDTTSSFGSFAIVEDERVVEEVIVPSDDGYSPILFGVIAELLKRHQWSLESIDCFAGAGGPGSFTGVRVGLTAVKGLAEGTGRLAVAVSNLQAIAALGQAELRAPWIDARRGEIYGGLYSADLMTLAPEMVATREAWERTLPQGAEIIDGSSRALAAAIGVIAARRFRDGLAVDPAAIDANYVRRSDAELFAKVF